MIEIITHKLPKKRLLATDAVLTKNINKMKASFFLTAICLLSLSAFLLWTKVEVNHHDTNISISEDDDAYTFKAHYNEANTRVVYNYLNESIRPDQLGNSENDYFDVTTSLPDNTKFYIKESPGRLKIILDKKSNSYASYMRIKKMCEGIKALLTNK